MLGQVHEIVTRWHMGAALADASSARRHARRYRLGRSCLGQQPLLEQLKKLDKKDEQALQEREALIGKVVVAALKEDRLSQEDFSGFMTPLITKRAEAKKLGLGSRSKAASPSNAPALTDAQDEAEVDLEDEPDLVP